jgi:two-component system, NtrC family, response regulator HydG
LASGTGIALQPATAFDTLAEPANAYKLFKFTSHHDSGMKKYSGNILVIDDDEHVLITSRMILKQYFANIETLDSPKTLDSKLRQQDYDVILLDMNFKAGITSGNEGIFWLTRISTISPQTQVVLQTAYGDIELAVKSIKEGAVDFLPKPWDKDKLVSTMINAYQQACARKENRELKTRQKALQEQLIQNHQSFIASDTSMRPVLQTIEQVAGTDANVLITGENGTGKEMVAQSIHQQSKRQDGPFIAVDLGSVPPALFESELFGHEKGAYTDAKEARIGKFELANKGTLFLDEVGNIPRELQIKLLTVLQGRTLTRLGSNKVIDLDVRVICATNSPIHELVQSGEFRQDLYYRINTIEIPLPPLRDRKEDIPLLARHYLEVYCKKYHKEVSMSDSLMDELSAYHWPGNVRELKHAFERAVILCTHPDLGIRDFQLSQSDAVRSRGNGVLNLNEVERNVIQQALRKCNGNLTRTAEELGIGRSTLYRKLEEYGISP